MASFAPGAVSTFFNRLPLELRRSVYEFILPEWHTIYVESKPQTIQSIFSHFISFKQVCPQVQSEIETWLASDTKIGAKMVHTQAFGAIIPRGRG